MASSRRLDEWAFPGRRLEATATSLMQKTWTLNHTAKLPKRQRFTFGQRLDNETLNVAELIVEAGNRMKVTAG